MVTCYVVPDEEGNLNPLALGEIQGCGTGY